MQQVRALINEVGSRLGNTRWDMDGEQNFSPPPIWFVPKTWMQLFPMPGWWLLHRYEGCPSLHQCPSLGTSLPSCPVFLSFKLLQSPEDSSCTYRPPWFPIKMKTNGKEKSKLRPYLTPLWRSTSAHTPTPRDVSKYTVPWFPLRFVQFIWIRYLLVTISTRFFCLNACCTLTLFCVTWTPESPQTHTHSWLAACQRGTELCS